MSATFFKALSLSLCALASLALAGCVTPGASGRLDTAASLARTASMTPLSLPTGTFTLASFVRAEAPGQPLTVYLEGDGLAWASRTRPSTNPTPTDPVALKLAALDRSANVAYLARPCQYVPLDREPQCSSRMWTSHRLSTDVVRATNRALDALKARTGASGLHLVGFSGGGGLIILAAAERNDVLSLRSVAGNLDTDTFTSHHRVTPMSGSRNPASVAAAVAHIPQIHYIGSRDTVVPRQIADAFVRRIPTAGRCLSIITANASHTEGWDAVWRTRANEIPTCS